MRILLFCKQLQIYHLWLNLHTHHGIFKNQNISTFKKHSFIIPVVCKVRRWGNAREEKYLGTTSVAGDKTWGLPTSPARLHHHGDRSQHKINNCEVPNIVVILFELLWGLISPSVLAAVNRNLSFIHWNSPERAGTEGLAASLASHFPSAITTSLASSTLSHPYPPTSFGPMSASWWRMVMSQVLGRALTYLDNQVSFHNFIT